MARRTVIIKATFFLDTDAFQHLSQWEKSLMDFYAEHGVEVERISVMGAGESQLFYTVRDMDVFNRKISDKAEKPQSSTKLLEKRKIEEKRALPKKMDISTGNIREKDRPEIRYSKGRHLPKAIREVPTIKYRPLKKK